MKKVLLSLVVAVTLMTALGTSAMAQGRGGPMGFLAGCLFGIRTAGDYNAGKEIHWREWCTLIPGFNIWNGIEGYNGFTTADYVTKYGAQYY